MPEGVHRRLQDLLDKQDQGQPLTAAEREEAQGLVDMAEWLSLLRLRAGIALLAEADLTEAEGCRE